MAEPTMVHFEEFLEGTYNFRTSKKHLLAVKSFKDGIASIEAKRGQYIRDMAEDIAGCFNEESNFAKVIAELFSEDVASFKAIRFKHGEVEMMITAENADENEIYWAWSKQAHGK